MRTGQLSFDDVIGTFDYTAKSTAERFLRRGNETYEVHFYDSDDKQRIDWFESEDRSKAEGAARSRHGGKISIIKIDVSNRTLAEIEALD